MSMIIGPYYMDFAVGTYINEYGFEDTLAEPLTDLDEFARETVLSLFDVDDLNIVKMHGVRTSDGWRVFNNEDDANVYIGEKMSEAYYGSC